MQVHSLLPVSNSQVFYFMTIILLEIENNFIDRILIIDKQLEKQVNDIIKGVKKYFIHIKIIYQDKIHSCLIIKNRIAYIYLDDAFEKSGLSFFLNDLYYDDLLYIN